MSAPRRRRVLPALLAALATTALLLQAVAAGAQEAELTLEEKSGVQRAVDATVDVLLLRTSGTIVLITGAGLFIPAAWATVPGGERAILEAREHFVDRSAAYVFTRPLGEF